MSKKRAKRYTEEEKEEILNFITAYGRGGQSAAVKKFKVTAATINSWKGKRLTGAPGRIQVSGGSRELKALHELIGIVTEIDATTAKLARLGRQYEKAKSKV